MDYTSIKKEVDVLVVGGGPGGSIAAMVLAHAGVKTVLLEKQSQHRDKVCGDGLIEDSQRLFSKLNLKSELLTKCRALNKVILYGPDNHSVTLESEFLTCPRKVLDQFLREKAEERGATLLYNHEVMYCHHQENYLSVGVKAKKEDKVFEIQTKMVILATGATTGALKKFQIPHREGASAVAGRAYYIKEDMSKSEPLHVIWDKNLVPGYGWFFPLKDNIYNVGIGVLSERYKDNNTINRLFEQFIEENPIAKIILKGAKPITDFKGAPLRCGLQGAKPSFPRILLVGEAIGTTYNLIGEGVGKAMETGQLAAKVALEALKNKDFSGEFLKKYDNELDHLFRKRYQQYAHAQRFSEYPWFINLMFNRANQNSKVKQKMIDILNEKRLPGEVLSIMGMIKSFL